jgi:superfamily II DNA or RNA helicase
MTSAERLELQQLLQADFWAKREGLSGPKVGSDRPNPESNDPAGHWKLTRGITLHSWQRQCVEAWFNAGKRGVIKVVTGAGKTVLALAIIERLQHEAANLSVAIVVPTITLLNQWHHELVDRGNLPEDAVGRLGAGFDDQLDSNKRILLCVLNSAARKLPEIVSKAHVSGSLLLVVDECHRAGSAEMQRIFSAERAFSLGLSATPERETDLSTDDDLDEPWNDEGSSPKSFDDSILGKELGPVIFELNYADAINLGVLAPFHIVHLGLSLLPSEQSAYDRVSREITTLRQELERPGRRGLGLIRWARSKAAVNNASAMQLLGLTAERKRLLFRMSERTKATINILKKAEAETPGFRAIIFHESIGEVMALFFVLREEGFPVVAEHSAFPDAMRAESLELFREGTARIIVSARSLIEGFNVPSADIGIVVAASTSVRQRIQTLGRLLRRNRNTDGAEKHARLYVLYASNTVDELIYEKADWEAFVGADRNSYFLWPKVEDTDPIPKSAPPRVAHVSEASISVESLHPGDTYPGNPDEGREFTRDSQGTIRFASGEIVEPNPELNKVLKVSARSSGRFRVTPTRNHVIELDKTADGWRAVYLGTLNAAPHQAKETDLPDRNWQPGDTYPLSKAIGSTFSVLQRDPRLIAQKERGVAKFVAPANSEADLDKRKALEDIQRFLGNAYQRGHKINKITVTSDGHVVYVYNNHAVFVGHAPEGRDGFKIEGKH